METKELLKMIEHVKSILRRPLVNSNDISEAIGMLDYIQDIEQQVEDAHNEYHLNILEHQSSTL
jgi:hypothetical protein